MAQRTLIEAQAAQALVRRVLEEEIRAMLAIVAIRFANELVLKPADDLPEDYEVN